MKNIDEMVDSMAPSKVRKELNDRGFSLIQVQREKLKELMKNIDGDIDQDANIMSDSPEPPRVTTRSRLKDHLQDVALQFKKETQEKASQYKKQSRALEQSARGLLNIRKNYKRVKVEHSNIMEVEIEDEESFEVEEILDVKDQARGGRERQFFVHWKGYPSEENSWVNESDLDLAPERYKLSVKAKKKLSKEK